MSEKPEKVSELIHAISKNSTLVSLNLEGNKLSEAQLIEILNAVLKN